MIDIYIVDLHVFPNQASEAWIICKTRLKNWLITFDLEMLKKKSDKKALIDIKKNMTSKILLTALKMSYISICLVIPVMLKIFYLVQSYFDTFRKIQRNVTPIALNSFAMQILVKASKLSFAILMFFLCLQFQNYNALFFVMGIFSIVYNC